jgi:hypothetical protein
MAIVDNKIMYCDEESVVRSLVVGGGSTSEVAVFGYEIWGDPTDDSLYYDMVFRVNNSTLPGSFMFGPKNDNTTLPGGIEIHCPFTGGPIALQDDLSLCDIESGGHAANLGFYTDSSGYSAGNDGAQIMFTNTGGFKFINYEAAGGMIFYPTNDFGTAFTIEADGDVTIDGDLNVGATGTGSLETEGTIKIDGSADVVQLTIHGHSTLTANLIEAGASGGQVFFEVQDNGNIVVGDNNDEDLFITFDEDSNDAIFGYDTSLEMIAIKGDDIAIVPNASDLLSELKWYNSAESNVFGKIYVETLTGNMVIHVDDTGDDLTLETSSGKIKMNGEVEITQDIDAVNLLITGHSSQSALNVVVEQNGGTDLVTIDNDGDLEAVTFSCISGGDCITTASISDSLDATNITDIYVLNTTDTMTGDLTLEGTLSPLTLTSATTANSVTDNRVSIDTNGAGDDGTRQVTIGDGTDALPLRTCWVEKAPPLNNVYYPNAVWYCPLVGTGTVNKCAGAEYSWIGTRYPMDVVITSIHCNWYRDLNDNDEIVYTVRKSTETDPDSDGGVLTRLAEDVAGATCTATATAPDESNFDDVRKTCNMNASVPKDTAIWFKLDGNNSPGATQHNCTVTICAEEAW